MTSPDGAPPSITPPPAAPDITLIGLANALLRSRRLVLGLMLLIGGIAAVSAQLASRRYTATASFTPQARRAAGSLGGLAAQLGVGLASGDAAQNPLFYVDLIQSPPILGPLADSIVEFATDTGRVRGRIGQIYKVRAVSRAAERMAVIDLLRGLIKPVPNVKTGLVTVTATTGWPELSAYLAARTVSLVDEFNLQSRQGQGSAERRFMEGRVIQARDSVRTAQEALVLWERTNADFDRSPALRTARARLLDDLTLKQSLLTTVAQALEQARIDEVRDTPLITMVEQATVPARPDARGRIRKTITGLFAGAVIAILIIMLRAGITDARKTRTEEYEEFQYLRRQAVREMLNPFRLLRRTPDV